MSECLSLAERASIEIESRRFADSQGYSVDWTAVSQLDDYSLVNAIAQIAPLTLRPSKRCLRRGDYRIGRILSCSSCSFLGAMMAPTTA